MREFRTTYADCLVVEITDEVWSQAVRVRRLNWKSDHRLTLAEAARCYGQMAIQYNAFDPDVIADLSKAFPNDGIEVTPAREYSVAVYLHVLAVSDLRKRVETFVRERFVADDVDWVDSETLRVWWD